MTLRCTLFAAAVFAAAQCAKSDVLDNVDPFVGTGGTGHTTPAAAYPFGMVQPGPDTGHEGWERCSGYQYGDKVIKRFSQNHLSGTGCSEFTDVSFMPSADDPAEALKRDYHAAFDKSMEKASPGYYGVTLNCGTKVEATCTRHVSLFRFTFPKDKKASLLFDPSWTFSKIKSVQFNAMQDRRASGHVDRHGWPGHEYYFAWEISAEPAGSRVVDNVQVEKGTSPKIVYEFDPQKESVVYLKVSLSRSSTEGARRNIDAEIPGWDFDGVLAANKAQWRKLLSRVEAKGRPDQLKALYTAMYHLFFQPNTISDVGEEDLYSTFSCWDTYRAAGPLYTIITPEYVPAFINSMLWHFDNNGFLPVWTLWGKDNQCMVGAHSVPMIVDAYLKGFKGVDWEKAFDCINKTLRENRGRWIARYELLEKYGYYPCDIIKDESVSKLLENCYDDACAYRMAKKLGRDADAKFFLERSRSWTKCYDAKTGFIRARDTKGNWREPFDPYRIHGEGHHNYTEGNAFHWNWHVMQDPDLLINMLGGKEAALKRLYALFNEDPNKLSEAPPDVTGLIGQYCHGNEPSHHNIYFFSLLGRRDLAAKYIREVMESQYYPSPAGLCGNDDCGQMSAWYIFACLGFYPFDPCGGEYVIGEAQLPSISIDVGGGKKFTVASEAPAEASRAVGLNDRKLEGVKIRHSDITKGGTLRFAGGKAEYEYVFDTSAAPELGEWMMTKMAPVVRKWYPKLVKMFPSEGWKAPKKLTFKFKDGLGSPAVTCGDVVTFDRKWIRENPKDVGCGIHELFHVVQNGYPKGPFYLQEGIADYVRWYLFEPEAHGCDMKLSSDDVRYDGAYRVSANFLNFVESKYPGIVRELNALCRTGKFDGSTFWEKRTGKGVKELEREWKEQSKQPFKYYRFAVDSTKRPSNCTQISEVELLDAYGSVIPSAEFQLSFDGGLSNFGKDETPDKAIDGDFGTKWLDFRADRNASAARRSAVWLEFKFAAPKRISGYRWYTANDYEERDPRSWRFLGSNDGVTWVVIDKVDNFNATSDRCKFAFANCFTADTPSWAAQDGSDAARVLAEAQESARMFANGAASRFPENERFPDLRKVFVNSYLDTICRTVKFRVDESGRDDTYVITGDIDAMWLRDSCAQVWPYLPLAKNSSAVARVIRGVVNRAFGYIRLDPYANAFYDSPRKSGHSGDSTMMLPGVHERKWEIDSLAYPLRLAHGYWRTTGDKTPFDAAWKESVRRILATFRVQQRRDGAKAAAEYSFARSTWSPTETLAHRVGAPVRPCGLIAAGFRPSDDACTFPFNVPGNIFAADTLAKAAKILREACGDDALANECEALSCEINKAVHEYAVFNHPEFGRVYAYEIDGYGGRMFMDDANAPSLLSIPYLCETKSYDLAVWEATRKMVLSKKGNPWFFSGTKGEGVGSPHTGYSRIWPMSIAMRVLVSHDKAEMAACVTQLLKTTGGTGAIHESFDVNDDRSFSRGWFAWADGLFAEAVIRAYRAGALK